MTVREKLKQDIASGIRSGGPWDQLLGGFAELAGALHTFQAEGNAPLRRYLRQMGPWADLLGPPLPTEAFKRAPLVTFPLKDAVACFRSSGTTVEDRGQHYLRTLELVDATIDATFRHFVLPELAVDERILTFVLAPKRADAPESSLSHMLQRVVETCGAEGSRHFVSVDWTLDVTALTESLVAASHADRPVLLLGTSFAYVHFLDAVPVPILLPKGSRLMDTGGYKGRTRAIPRAELHTSLGAALGLKPGQIVGEYGMSELSSQLYEQGDVYQAPPWCLVRVVDPVSLMPVAVGEVGHIALFDLANLDSVAHLLTGDQGRIVPLDGAGVLNALGGLPSPGLGLELLGRAPSAAPKGCSIALDAALRGELELAP